MTHPDDPGGTLDSALDGAPLDAAMQAAAEEYHAPPPVPTEAMWVAIQTRRATGPSSERTPGTDRWDPPVRPLRPPAGRQLRRELVRRWTPLAAAAVLLVGVGIGIGRRSALPDAAAPDGIARVDSSRPPRLATSDGRADRSNGAPAGAPAGDPAATTPPREPVRAAPAPHDVRAPRVLTADSPGAMASAAPRDSATTPLRAATEQHLAQAEALLTTFAMDARRDGPARTSTAPDSAWARDLLTTTRLLLDSPAASDPARHRLLEDLELVLVQIARLPRADTPEERALIDRAIRRGDLMAKLRAGTAGTTAPIVASGT